VGRTLLRVKYQEINPDNLNKAGCRLRYVSAVDREGRTHSAQIVPRIRLPAKGPCIVWQAGKREAAPVGCMRNQIDSVLI